MIIMERLGWTLVHFVWQGALIAGVYALARRTVRGAEARYLLSCATLAVLMGAPIATFLYLGHGSAAATGVVGGGAVEAIKTAGAANWQPDFWSRAVPWIAVAWLGGVLVLLGRLAGGWMITARMRKSGVQPVPGEWHAMLHALTERLGMARPVKLLASMHVEAPTVIGWVRPLILMPVSALAGLPREHVEALLAHELAHIRRHDYLVNLVQSVAEALLFYHPAVWWVSGELRAERELCCDDVAVAAGGDVLTYARALASFEGLRPAHVRAVVTANGNSLRSRIRRLLNPAEAARDILPGPGAGWAVVLAMAGICAVAVMPAAPPQGAVVDRKTIWADTVKRGDMLREVRGLGTMTSDAAAEIKVADSQAKELASGQSVLLDVMIRPAQAAPGKAVVMEQKGGKEIPLGQKVLMRPQTVLLNGTVVRVTPGAPGGMVTVEVKVTGQVPAGVNAGQQVDGTIVIERLKDVVYVARPVFGKADSEAELFKVAADGNSAVRTKVQFGRSSVNTIEVRGGLQVGDKVIVSDMSAQKGVDRVMLK